MNKQERNKNLLGGVPLPIWSRSSRSDGIRNIRNGPLIGKFVPLKNIFWIIYTIECNL